MSWRKWCCGHMRIGAILFFISLMACNRIGRHHKQQKNKPVDGFYTDKGDWDDSRIPLLKPYELIQLKGHHEWEMSLKTPFISTAVHNVTQINVVDSIIFIHSGETDLRGGVVVTEAWFVIDPNRQSEKGFAKKKQFDQELMSLKIKSPNLFDPEKIYQFFINNETIEWNKLGNITGASN